MDISLEKREVRTKQILLVTSILQEPLAALITLLPLLIIKELHATAFQISVLTALLPTVAILSFYWGSFLDLKSCSYRIRKNLVLSTYFAAFLFLLSPLSNDPWIFVLAGACYTLFWRAANPARMELLKRNISNGEREKVYSHYFKISYAVGMILAPLLGILIDSGLEVWKWLFVAAGTLYMISGWVYSHIPLDTDARTVALKKPFWKVVSDPWKVSYEILQKNPTFLHFQIGFFIAGFGLMFAKPAGDWLLGSLNISYLALSLCRNLVKGLGVIGTAKVWGEKLNRSSILQLSYIVCFGFMVYNALLLGGYFSVGFIFLAYLIYGVAQSGSHLVWNLSGTLLSGSDSSHQYTSVNILAVGIRGCVTPVLGGLFLSLFGVEVALIVGVGILFSGAWYLSRRSEVAGETVN